MQPSCESYQFFKNIIQEKGRASVDTSSIVGPSAQKTYSEQLVNHLMLSDAGQADTKPTLMIEADDVKCSHGATVGKLDEDSIFILNNPWFKSRKSRSIIDQWLYE